MKRMMIFSSQGGKKYTYKDGAENIIIFCGKKIIKEEEKKIYDYCMEVLLASVINFLAMFGIAVFIQMTLLALCFMVGFAVIRITAGGFHANTHIKCFGIMISIYVVVLIILRKIPEKEILFFTTICSICSSIVILILSPVENKNRLIDREDSLKFKRQC